MLFLSGNLWGIQVFKENRLARRDDFQKVYRYGKSAANQQFVLYKLAKPGQAELRLGVSVSKKLGNAIVRNRLRRMMKEIVRHHLNEWTGGVDIVIIARKPITDLDYAAMERALLHVARRSSLMKRGAE